MRAVLLASGFGLLALAAPSAVGQSAPPALRLPLACKIGETCFVQQYMDHDPGPGAKDWRCGTRSYDGHEGTDFRVPTAAAMRAGVTVTASAAGVVSAVRDGVADGAPPAKDRECGNGVAIDHGGGWRTQYCHMAKGSVRVKAGDKVAVGAALGRVGLSGKTQFPHVHLSVFKDGARVDPFLWGARAGSCGGGRSLWAPDVARSLAYRSPELLNAGFASGPVTMEQVEQAVAPAAAPTAPALVVWARAIGLEAGDVARIELISPEGRVLSTNTSAPMDRPKAQHLLFTGERSRTGRWPAGAYKARYTVTRGGALVLDRSVTLSF